MENSETNNSLIRDQNSYDSLYGWNEPRFDNM